MEWRFSGHKKIIFIMKKTFVAAFAFAAAMMLQSCGAGLVGSLYTNVTTGGDLGANATVGKKVGEASATSILGLIATGDAGYNAAAENGGIKKISHADVSVNSILGIFTTYKTVVYGE